MGAANKKSVATHIGKLLSEQGARVLYSVRSEARKKSLEKLLSPAPIFVCDVERPEEIAKTPGDVAKETETIHGLVHSIAFANYADGLKPFPRDRQSRFPAIGGYHLLFLDPTGEHF